jgi:hypothetical protein
MQESPMRARWKDPLYHQVRERSMRFQDKLGRVQQLATQISIAASDPASHRHHSNVGKRSRGRGLKEAETFAEGVEVLETPRSEQRGEGHLGRGPES